MSESMNEARAYQLQFIEALKTVFESQAYFGDFFAGGLETKEGVENGANAFMVKTSDVPVVVNSYNSGANVGFGTGTANTSRFGARSEVIYEDTPAPYSWNWSIHDGLDRMTVNNNLEAAVADRLVLHARAKVRKANEEQGDFLSANAGITDIALTDYTEASVIALFDAMDSALTNAEASGQYIAVLNGQLYNAVVNSGLAVTDKNSNINIGGNQLPEFKGFALRKAPDSVMAGNCCIAGIEEMAKAFVGVNTVRTVESEDFDGLALQGAGKGGQFILDDNKAALIKITAPSATP